MDATSVVDPVDGDPRLVKVNLFLLRLIGDVEVALRKFGFPTSTHKLLERPLDLGGEELFALFRLFKSVPSSCLLNFRESLMLPSSAFLLPSKIRLISSGPADIERPLPLLSRPADDINAVAIPLGVLGAAFGDVI
mmetsp:Transcript_33301/g.53497  ORF Transcript_33301/g.53497 Transcript_33301/m.53497 type:complete len:136 (-) Transcript_33301:3502-3909(-)